METIIEDDDNRSREDLIQEIHNLRYEMIMMSEENSILFTKLKAIRSILEIS